MADMNAYLKPVHSVEMDLAGRKLTLQTGLLAHQALGSCLVTLGDTQVLCNVMANSEVREGTDFFPMTVDYEEKFYAAGKMSGSRYIKREAKPSENATLTSRLIDRPLRPMFPKGMINEVQVVCTVLSADLEVSPATTALIGASAALALAGLPIEAPVSAVRVGMIDGKFVINPTYDQAETGDLDLIVAGTEDALMMVEARANELTDEQMLSALELGHKYIKDICQLQQTLIDKVKPEPFKYTVAAKDESKLEMIKAKVASSDLDAVNGLTKQEFKYKLKAAVAKYVEVFAAEIADETLTESDIKSALETLVEKQMRKNVLEKGLRLDGRSLDEVRPVTCDVSVLKRTHGSGLFQRGETQVLNICTLAGPGSGEHVDTMDQNKERRYMHHYNFPGYCVGEVRPQRSPGRREIGHGYLAERALLAVLPPVEEFPYVIRTVSEVMSCNGSSSMASVCGSTLSLMDAGVPLKSPVAGIAMGLVTDGADYKILSDIQGPEDFGGDMDFKVAASKNGITALQMDIKLKGLKMSLLKEALDQAKMGLDMIMQGMLKAIPTPRTEMSPYAPVIETIFINPDKIREVIGKGGETIQKITKESETEINIEQDGRVSVTAPNREKADMAINMTKMITVEPEVGTDYDATVVNITAFGAFVEFMPGKEGLVHISKLTKERLNQVTDYVQLGDTIKVRLTEVDREGRYNLTHIPFTTR